LIDYKSAGTYNIKAIKDGSRPQLPLEALILNQGGFKDIKDSHSGYIGYWKLTGTRKGTEVIGLGTAEGLSDLIESTDEGFRGLLQAYADADTPFTCRPDPGRIPRFDDYKHLARVDEWANDEDGQEDAA
jgi:ATP-dependent helicase/nuclease subunit B